jgi:hypothetical protein
VGRPGLPGQTDVIKAHAPKAKDFTNRRYRHRGVVDEAARARNRTKSKVRAKVEHAIGVIKRVFGFAKVRYRGLDKNAHRLFVNLRARQSVHGAALSLALPGDVVLLEGGVVCLHSWERTPQTPKTATKRHRLPVHSLAEQLSMTASKSSATYSDLP